MKSSVSSTKSTLLSVRLMSTIRQRADSTCLCLRLSRWGLSFTAAGRGRTALGARYIIAGVGIEESPPETIMMIKLVSAIDCLRFFFPTRCLQSVANACGASCGHTRFLILIVRDSSFRYGRTIKSSPLRLACVFQMISSRKRNIRRLLMIGRDSFLIRSL